MNSPQISVIVPIYNTEKYIEKCCRSLFEQTLESIEYIFIDDCSPDHSIAILWQVLEEYPHRKEQVKMIRQEQNLGVAMARQDGIQLASGEYLIHCDSDDWIAPDMYRKLYQNAKTNDADMVFCEYYTVNRGVTTRIELPSNTTKKRLISNLLCGKILGGLPRSMVRLSLIKNNTIDFPCDDMIEDLTLTLQFVYFSERISIMNDPLYYYNYNPESICNTNQPTLRCECAKNNLEIIMRFFQYRGIYSEYENEFIAIKYNVRMLLWPLLSNTKRFYAIWGRVYPELNTELFFSKNLSIRYKIIFLLVQIRVYPFIQRLKRYVCNG